MRCEKCNVEIGCKADVCPLCHSPLECDGEVAFPVPATKRVLFDKFRLIYSIIAILASIACITVNVVFNHNILWCLPVIVCLIYVYYFVCASVSPQKGFHKRILGQAAILSIVFIVFKLVFGGEHLIFVVWLPIVYFLSDALMLIFIFKNRRYSEKYILTLILLCVLGVVPCVCAFIFDISIKIPSIVATSVSGLILILTICFRHKDIKAELKKAFHL